MEKFNNLYRLTPYKIPTLTQCIELCEKNINYTFKKYHINNTDIFIFKHEKNIDYLNIEIPIEQDIEGFELNNLVYINNKYYLSNRFYENINIDTLLCLDNPNNINNNEILYTINAVKYNDLFRYIIIDNEYYKIHNGNIFKQDISVGLKCFIDWTIENNIVALFNQTAELCSIRYNDSGIYIPFTFFEELYTWDIKIKKQHRHYTDLNDIMHSPDKVNQTVFFVNQKIINIYNNKYNNDKG